MNNPDDYAFKLVCVDETNPIEYEVLEDVNVGDLREMYHQLLQRIGNHNIGEQNRCYFRF